MYYMVVIGTLYICVEAMLEFWLSQSLPVEHSSSRWLTVAHSKYSEFLAKRYC